MIDKNVAAKLVKLAKEMLDFSYSPYSEYKVGAALLTKSGKIYLGCNIENASYSPTVCAERVAFFKAVSEGEKEFSAIAIAGGHNGNIEGIFPPCGVCRQVMTEFCDKEFEIILATKEGYESFTLEQILPLSFGKSNLSL